MYIKDLQSGEVHEYGTNCHDSLRITDDGRMLSYENLQNGDDSHYGDYRFVTDKNGKIPGEDLDLIAHGADAYFNIGGFKKGIEWLIEQYQDEVNELEEERRMNKGIGFGDAMNCGKIGAYARVIEDLKELLEEDDADE